jgi:hypothetical protein
MDCAGFALVLLGRPGRTSDNGTPFEATIAEETITR